MLHDRDLASQQHRMHGALASSDAVDIQRVDSHQRRSSLREPLGRALSEVRMPFEISVGAPVAIPASAKQHRSSPDLTGCDWNLIDRRSGGGVDTDDQAVEVSQRLERQLGQVLSVFVTMKWAVDVRP